MGGRLTRGAPLAASLLGHVALLAAFAATGLFTPPAARPPPAPVSVSRAPDAAAPPGFRLVLRAPATEEPAAPEDTVVSLDSADPRYRPYLAVVRRRIWERWHTPLVPAGRPIRGTLVVEFTLTRSGRLAAADVSEPSGVAALDRAALEAVARSVPFAPLPDTIAGAELRVRARFTYD